MLVAASFSCPRRHAHLKGIRVKPLCIAISRLRRFDSAQNNEWEFIAGKKRSNELVIRMNSLERAARGGPVPKILSRINTTMESRRLFEPQGLVDKEDPFQPECPVGEENPLPLECPIGKGVFL